LVTFSDAEDGKTPVSACSPRFKTSIKSELPENLHLEISV
jgi:hypothetical protein